MWQAAVKGDLNRSYVDLTPNCDARSSGRPPLPLAAYGASAVDARPAHGARGQPLRRRGRVGIPRMNGAPPDGEAPAHALPPWAVAIAWTIASPSPAPPASRERAPSRRWKRSKIATR